MTREEFEAQQQAIPDDKLVEMAQNALSKLCETGGRSLTMTVPPRVDDTDMIISELIRRFKDKQPLPPAKGAEEMIRERFGADVFENPPYYPTFAVELQQLMETFAALHAQRLAEKMVEDQLPSNKEIRKLPTS